MHLKHQLKARLLALAPRAFELFAGDLLEFMGLQHVAVTRYSGDGGIDAHGQLEAAEALLSIPIGVQVKRYRDNVQRTDIDRFIGALNGSYSQGIFITTSGYTQQAMLKARSGNTKVTPINGDQITLMMLRYSLGVTASSNATHILDEAYFGQLESQARPNQLRERQESYRVSNDEHSAIVVQPENDLISLRALSHALRVDTTTLRHWIERGTLRPDSSASASRSGYFFRRDRIETLRGELLAQGQPEDADTWRQEFLDFVRSRSMTKSYKPVLLKALLKLVDREGKAALDGLVTEFRTFYHARYQAGLPIEFGPPDLLSLSDAALRELIIRQPLERFLIKGFIEYHPGASTLRLAPQLWSELRAWELLDIQQSTDQQLAYYYSRPR